MFKKSFILLFALLILLPTKTKAIFEEVLDQQNVPNISGSYHMVNLELPGTIFWQTFTPTKNRLTKVEIPLHDAGGQMNLFISQNGVLDILGSIFLTSRDNFGARWFTFEFENPITVTPGTTYRINVLPDLTNRLSSQWISTGSNSYSQGNSGFLNTSGMNSNYKDDLGFKTYGYNFFRLPSGILSPDNQSQSEPEASADETEDQSSETQANHDATSNNLNNQINENNSSSQSNQTTNTSSSDQQSVATLIDPSLKNVAETNTQGTNTEFASESNTVADQSIAPPTLDYVLKNNAVISAPIEETIEISSTDIVRAIGKGQAKAKIVLFVGDTSFSNEINDQGIWTVSLDPTALKSDSYDIFGQTQIDEKGSQKEKLFSLKVKNPSLSSQEKNLSWDDYLLIIILALIIIGAIILLFWRIRRQKNKTIDITSRYRTNLF